MSLHREAAPDHLSKSGHLATASHHSTLVLHIVLTPWDSILFVTGFLSLTGMQAPWKQFSLGISPVLKTVADAQ